MNPMPETRLSNCFYSTSYNCYVKPFELVEQLKSQPMKFTTARWSSSSSLLRRFTARLVALMIGRRLTYTLNRSLSMEPSLRFLDFGCGAGTYLFLLRKLGYSNLFAWDISSNSEVTNALNAASIEQLPTDFTETALMEGEFV
jgi:SAM-dependent methyltransferase